MPGARAQNKFHLFIGKGLLLRFLVRLELVELVHMVTLPGKFCNEKRFLNSGISSADNHNILPVIIFRVASGTVGYSFPLVFDFSRYVQLTVGRTGGMIIFFARWSRTRPRE